jgi:hypothetical protein
MRMIGESLSREQSQLEGSVPVKLPNGVFTRLHGAGSQPERCEAAAVGAGDGGAVRGG